MTRPLLEADLVEDEPWPALAWGRQMQAWAARHGVNEPTAWISMARRLHQGRTVLPTRSTDEPVVPWVASCRTEATLLDSEAFVHLVESGLAPADVFAAARLTAGAVEGPTSTAKNLLGRISTLDIVFDGIGARDALGWMFTVGVDSADKFDQVRVWESSRVGPDGWVYAAAGMSPAEAAHATRAGTIDVDQARILAALRGAAMPVG